MSDYWDAQAATFDDEPDHGLADPTTRAAWRHLLEEALPDEPGDVLDLGCGTGTLAELVSDLGHRVRALDSAPAMVEAARAKLARRGYDVPVLVADAAAPPYDAASADAIVCRHVLWALPDPAAALARWTTVLRPGGRLVLVEGRWHTGGGITADDCVELVRAHLPQVSVRLLPEPVYWGGPITDERYLLVAR